MLYDSRELNTAKQAQSAVHQYGREGMLSELYGVTGWEFDFRGHKLAGDWQAALGVTVRVHHLTWTSRLNTVLSLSLIHISNEFAAALETVGLDSYIGYCLSLIHILPEDLKTNFQSCLEKVNRKLQSFQAETELQKARALLQKQVFDKTGEKAEIYLMNMPTGSGKTLCSVKFALEKAIAEKKKRIIYVIPFLSVIDQSVEMFENLFGKDAQILRHQSTFSYDDAEDFLSLIHI